MNLNPSTYEYLNVAKNNMSIPMVKDTDVLIEQLKSNSPMTDTCRIIERAGLKLHGIKLPVQRGWVPIRNLLRIIAYLGKLDLAVVDLNIISMYIGCAYFSGYLSYTVEGKQVEGEYHWQWTSFPGIINFDKFTNFPTYSNSMVMNKSSSSLKLSSM